MIQSRYHELMIKLRTMFALASCVAALGLLVACNSVAPSPFSTPPLPSTATATPVPETTSEPTAAAIQLATSTVIAPTSTPIPIPLPTAALPAAGWTWYENTAHAYRIIRPEAWSVRTVTQPSGLIHQAIFTSPETGSEVVVGMWDRAGLEPDLAAWVNAFPDRAIHDFPDEPVTYNATVLGRPAVFHYHPARWGTNDFAVVLFDAGEYRYRILFNSATLPVTEGEPQTFRTMLENLFLYGELNGETEIPTGWKVGAGLVIDTRPIETAAGEIVDPAAAPYVPDAGTGGIEGTFENWQEETFPYRFTLVTDAGEPWLIRVEASRVHFRGQPIDHWFNANAVERPGPGERVWVAGRLIAPNEVVADSIDIERGGVWQAWFIPTLLEMTPETGEVRIPTSGVISTSGNPHMWLRGPLQTMAGLLVDEEPPVLPTEWQPYADRTALAYGLVNADGYVEIAELFVQDGPCDVTPLTTHCQVWLQIYPTSSADR